jgi:hypothetical protein
MTKQLAYIARVSSKNGKALFKSQPHATREEAIAECFSTKPRASECSTSEALIETISGVRMVFEYHRNIQFHARAKEWRGGR